MQSTQKAPRPTYLEPGIPARFDGQPRVVESEYAFPSLDDGQPGVEPEYAAAFPSLNDGAVEHMYSSQPAVSLGAAAASRSSATTTLYEYGNAAQARVSAGDYEYGSAAQARGSAGVYEYQVAQTTPPGTNRLAGWRQVAASCARATVRASTLFRVTAAWVLNRSACVPLGLPWMGQRTLGTDGNAATPARFQPWQRRRRVRDHFGAPKLHNEGPASTLGESTPLLDF